MSGNAHRPAPPPDHDENPEWTEDDFANATWGPPDWWKPSDTLRLTAQTLRREADRLEAEADRMDGDSKPHAAE